MVDLDVNWTAVSAITTVIGTGVVAWYTYETQQLRLLTKKQVDTLSAGVQPHFQFESLKYYCEHKKYNLTVYNYGGQARDLAVTSSDVSIKNVHGFLDSKSHQHWDIFDKGGQSIMHPQRFSLTINYIDQYGAAQNKVFCSDNIEVSVIEK